MLGALAMRRAATRPSSVWVGGMRMSTMATSGWSRATIRNSSSASAASPTTSTPASDSSRASPERTSMTSSATTTRMGSLAVTVIVPLAAGSESEVPAEGADPVGGVVQSGATTIPSPPVTSTRTVMVSPSWTTETWARVAADGWLDGVEGGDDGRVGRRPGRRRRRRRGR